MVLITTKGEAVAIAIAQASHVELLDMPHGQVAKIKRIIMDRDVYAKSWGKGPHAVLKKQMIVKGQLDRYGKPNAETPEEWKKSQIDYRLPAKPQQESPPPAIAPADGAEAKKRKVSESAEDRALRKKAKADKKAAKAAAKSA